MLKNQKRYISYLDQQSRALEGSTVQCASSATLRETVAQTELLVPVVGSFSAGKSTLINSFIGRELLAVGIRPETELATELRYSDDERIEAVTLNGELLRFDISEISSLKARANEFLHLRLWVKCEPLARIQPLVLVDMPGFDSTLSNHNKAIANYIDQGAHYLVVVSVETGGITRSMERQLADIQEMGRGFSLVLSKTNVRAQSEIDDVAAKIVEQLDDAFGRRFTPTKIGLDGAVEIQATLDAIDPEQLIAALFDREVKRTHVEITETINVALAGLNASSDDNAHAIGELNAGLVKIERTREDLVADVEARYSAGAVRDCVDSVGRALEESIQELVAAGMSGNRETLSRSVTDIVRGAMIRKIKAQMSEIGQTIVGEFALQLGDLNTLMTTYTAGADWVGGVTTNTTQLLEQANRGVSRLSEYLTKKNGTQTIYKVATTILAVTTNVVFPLLELVIIFLPDLLQPFFEARRRETIETNIRTEMIPGIKSSLREKLPDIFREQVELLLAQVSGQFESAIAEKKEALEKLEQKRQSEHETVRLRAAGLRDLQQRLNDLASEYLYRSEVLA